MAGDGVEVGSGEDVFDACGVLRIHVHAAENAAQPPLVLVFDVRRVGPADTDQRDVVAAALGEGGDVERAGQPAVFAHAHERSVDPDAEHAFGGAHLQHLPAAVPGSGDGEAAAVNAGGVVSGGLGRKRGRGVGPGHLHVGVDGAAVTVLGPVAGHGQVVPGAVGRCGLHGPGRHGFGALKQAKLPRPVERQRPRRGGGVERLAKPQGGGTGGAGHERCSARQAVEVDCLGGFPETPQARRGPEQGLGSHRVN